VPYSVTGINFFISFFILGGSRIAIKKIFQTALQVKRNHIIIYGAGTMGQAALNTITTDKFNNWKVIGFADDDAAKLNKNISGIPIYDLKGISKILQRNSIERIIIAVNNISVERRNEVAEFFIEKGLPVSILPHNQQWLEDPFKVRRLRDIKIEDLLERDEISLPYEMVQDAYKDSTILVTGAAGSIGSEICRQLAKFTFKKLVLLDQSESGLFDLEYELRTSKNRQQLRVEVASIRDAAKLKKVFTMHKPDFVFHAAAYKHVPLMETFTSEAVLTNIFGTKIVADLAMAFKVKKFVMVSTDKAVNPSNVMGTTKRISEIYIQSLSDRQDSQTAFITTRFGNVLGSAGSVVRTFNKQIKAGGPITITHPEITRYFMTIPEASKLVLEAGKIGESGDILLFDMGEPVKIMDLAKRMIQLAGLKPTDIAIVQTGLRPGEKMYEELFKDSEEFAETYHPRILRAKKSPNVNGEFNNLMNELREVALMHNNEMIPFILRKMVPEFTSSTGALNKVVSEKELESLKN